MKFPWLTPHAADPGGRGRFFVLVRSRQILDNLIFWGLRLDSHEKVNMTPAIFRPNCQTISQFMSIFVPKPDFLIHFRDEQNLADSWFSKNLIFWGDLSWVLDLGKSSTIWFFEAYGWIRIEKLICLLPFSGQTVRQLSSSCPFLFQNLLFLKKN